jgi:hypothetical protein
LERILRLVASFGIFESTSGGFGHTATSRLLRRDHPTSLRAFVAMNGLPVIWKTIAALDHSVRTGRPSIECVDPGGFFGYLGAHPDEERIFAEAMAARAAADIAAVLSAYDFRPFRAVADIGGGRGHLPRAVLDATPTAPGLLFDLPGRGRHGRDRIRSVAGQRGRLLHRPAACGRRLPLMDVLHDWSDDKATDILRAVRAAAAPGAVVLVIEDLLSDQADSRALTLDVITLAVTGGQERTADRFGELLRDAGFRPTGVVSTGGPRHIVEATAI